MIPKQTILKLLKTQISNEQQKQANLQQSIENINTDKQKSRLPLMRTEPFLAISRAVRRYKSFSITLVVPRSWPLYQNLVSMNVIEIARYIHVLRSDTHVEARGCRCRKNGDLVSVLIFSEEKKTDELFAIRHYSQYSQFAWSECRIHCATSRSHFGSDLILSLDIPGFPSIRSQPFSSIRLSKEKASAVDLRSDFLRSFYNVIPSNLELRMNSLKTSCVFVAVGHTKYFSETRFKLICQSFSSRGLLQFKTQTMGKIYFSFVCFTTVYQLQSFVTELINFFSCESIFVNPVGCYSFDRLFGTLFSFFSNGMYPYFNINDESVITSRARSSHDSKLSLFKSSPLHDAFIYSFDPLNIKNNCDDDHQHSPSQPPQFQPQPTQFQPQPTSPFQPISFGSQSSSPTRSPFTHSDFNSSHQIPTSSSIISSINPSLNYFISPVDDNPLFSPYSLASFFDTSEVEGLFEESTLPEQDARISYVETTVINNSSSGVKIEPRIDDHFLQAQEEEQQEQEQQIHKEEEQRQQQQPQQQKEDEEVQPPDDDPFGCVAFVNVDSTLTYSNTPNFPLSPLSAIESSVDLRKIFSQPSFSDPYFQKPYTRVNENDNEIDTDKRDDSPRSPGKRICLRNDEDQLSDNFFSDYF